MPSPVTFDIDPRSMRAFESALRQYSAASKRTNAEIVNKKAVDLAFRAAQLTKKADKFSVRSGKGIRNPWAFTKWDLKRRGKKLPKSRDAMINATRRVLNARAARVGFIAAGWAQAGRKLKAQAGVKGGSVKGFGRKLGRGSASMARATIRAFAELVNKSTSKSESSPDALVKHGSKGAADAIRFVTADMLVYARRKYGKTNQAFNRGR